MSVITTEKDYSSNNPLDAGYFRVGFVTLQIPPQDIVTSRVVNNEKITPLRGMNEMFQKTGQARWDVTVSWTALLNDANQVTRYQQWEDLRNMVAIFKAAPFVEVESPHLRQMLAAHDPEFSTRRLSMGLRQLRVDNHPDVIDALKVTLTMTYFNCLPYTQDFGYQGDSGQSVSAYQSQKFKKYISQWRQINMERAFRYPGDPICPLWLTQNPGELTLKWRTYLPIQSGQVPDYAGQLNAPATIGGTVVPSTVTSKAPKGKVALPPAIAQLIQQIAPQFGLDPAIMQGICWYESKGNPNAKSPNSTATGLFQLLNGTAKAMGVTNSYDPTQNTTGACKLMSQLYRQFGSYELAIAAYNAGSAYVKCYLNGTSQTLKSGVVINPGKQMTGGIPPAGVPAGENVPKYISTVMSIAQSPFGYNGTATSTTPTVTPSPAPATNATTPASSGSNPTTTTSSSTEAAFEAQVANLVAQGWSVDHRADPGGVGVLFLYKENELRVAPQDSNSGGVQPGLWPEGISVLFVNNLAQIPLAGFQYPTYQHVGPCSSLVQVSFGSLGTRNNPNTDEPIHNGLMTLTSMAHMLEQQYQRLRTQFRSIASVHRMHAVYVENQVLNMLGIFGLMLDQVTTETVPDSSDMAMAQLTACQYENKFEELTSYKVNAIDGVYMTALQQTVLQGDTLAQAATAASPDERALMGAAFTYRQHMASSDENDMSARLLNAAENPSDSSPFGFMTGAQSFFVSETDANALTNEFMEKSSSYPVAAARVKQLQQSGNTTQWTMADYLMFKSCAYDAAGTGAITSLVSSIDQGLAADTDLSRQKMVSDVYSRLFPYFAENDPSLRNALNQIMQSPTLGASIKNSVSASDPALSNSDHGAYRDMGLNSQVLDGEDFNPGMYFTSDKTTYLAKTRTALGNITAQIASGSSQLNSDNNGYQVPAGTIPLSTTTSIPGNMDSIMKMINVPGYSMTEAFPTFKLFFMEDANSGIYYAFDNFYSYSAVIDIEVQRPTNKPATLRMKLMNLTHLLSHKLYDASLAGKWEASLDRFAINTGGTAAATGSDVPTKGFVGRNGIGGAPYQIMGKDNTEGYAGGDMSNRRIPLQYFPLQTGSKIQLRVGFSNNPDKLTPVFCGEVTEIEGNEILTVTAQSYLLELASLSGDKMNSNSWFQLGSLLQNTVNILIPGSGGGMSKGPAYGGVTIFGDAGDVGTVIWMMLKNSGAKHFGHWQVNSPANSLLKGFSWKELAAAPAAGAASVAGMDNVATALQNVYDRCDENIMVDTAVQYDGTSVSTDPKTHSQSRSWMDQRKYPWAPASYYVDSKTTLTVWELIQDIARRYPEYLLLEKWYGFPYSCDATLVFGHPFDWYTARPQMLGDTERVRALNQNNQAYTQWWSASGKQMFLDVMGDGTMPVTVALYKNQLLQQAGASPSGLAAALQSLLTIAVDGVDTGSQTANDWLALPGKLIYTIIPGEKEALRNLQKKINAVQSAYYASILAGDQKSTDFLKPVRRYHFIDHQSIVHNGMRVNDKIYNCIRIGDPEKNGKTYPILANASIPPNHVRALDVTDQINDPKQNVIDQSLSGNTGLIMAYGQSFLREELGKMYRGEIVLRCIPEIEPQDVLLITDPSTGMVGPIEVETVTHVMNLESGFITIIKPRAVITINEAASANFFRMLMMAMGTVIPEIHRLSNLSVYSWMEGAAVATATAVGAGAVVAGLSYAGGAVATAAEGTGLVALAAGATTEWAAAGAAFLCGPPGWIILGLCAIAAVGAAVWWFTDSTAKLNPVVICPCTKFGRPWVGGIEGWSINDLVGVVNNKAMQFVADEIFPLIDAWKAFHGYPAQIPPTPQPSWGLSAP